MQAAIQREGSTTELIQIERLDADIRCGCWRLLHGVRGQTQLLDLQIRHTSNHSQNGQTGMTRIRVSGEIGRAHV